MVAIPVTICSHYLVPIIVANAKYSVNRRFTLPRHRRRTTVSDGAQNAILRPPWRTAGTLKTQTNLEKTAGLETFRPRPQPERMIHKSRLAPPRQGLVCASFM